MKKDWDHKLRYQIKDAISYVGINPKTSGGWQDHITKPVVDDLVERINKLFASQKTEILDEVIKELGKMREIAKAMPMINIKSQESNYDFNSGYDWSLVAAIKLLSDMREGK